MADQFHIPKPQVQFSDSIQPGQIDAVLANQAFDSKVVLDPNTNFKLQQTNVLDPIKEEDADNVTTQQKIANAANVQQEYISPNLNPDIQMEEKPNAAVVQPQLNIPEALPNEGKPIESNYPIVVQPQNVIPNIGIVKAQEGAHQVVDDPSPKNIDKIQITAETPAINVVLGNDPKKIVKSQPCKCVIF